MYNIYIICISLRMRVHVCVRHLPTDCDRTDRSSFEKLFYTLLFFFTLPPFLSMGSIRHLVFFRQPNDARKRANHWPRDTCAILIWRHVSFKIVPLFSSPYFLGKENCPEKLIEERSRRPQRKISSSFFPFLFFFFFLDPRTRFL